jgi:hypothetical protein
MPQERLPMCKIRDVLRLKAGGSTTPTPSDARRPARADVKRSQGRLAAESEAMTGSRGLGNVAAETDCVADDAVDVEPVSPVLPCLTLLSP